MAAILAKLSLLQRIAENFTWEEFSRACAEEKQNLGVINVKEVKFRNVKIDFYLRINAPLPSARGVFSEYGTKCEHSP